MLTIYANIELEDFQPWSGAEETFENIKNEGKLDELKLVLEEIFYNKEFISETELNDLLWFESDFIYTSLCMESYLDEDEDEEEDDIEE